MAKQLDLLAGAKEEPEKLQLTASLEWGEIEAAEGGEKIPTFKMNAYGGGPMEVSGFFRPVVVDLSGAKTSNKQIPIFREHHREKVVGHGEAIISATDITASGMISADNEHSRDVVTSAKRGFPWQASIGASVEEFENVKEGEKIKVNGKTITGPVLVARKSTIYEISVVALGADRKTKTTVAASGKTKGKKNMDDFTKWLIANDFIEDADDLEVLSDKATKKLKAQFEAEQKPPESPHGADFLKTLKAEREEKQRIDEIDKLAEDAIRDYPTQLERIENLVNAAHADKKMDARGFELALLRDLRPHGPSSARPAGGNEVGSIVLTAAICKTLKMRSLEKAFDSKTLEATDKYFRHGIGLQQLLFRAAAGNGEHIDSAANTRRLLEAAFGRTSEGMQLRAGGFSTISLPGILADVMNKMLHDYFNAVDSTWRLISAISPVRDFREVNSYSLSGDLEYEQVGPAGEIKHGTLGETPYGNKADTYGKMLAITRQDIINDDLGAFQRIPQKLGRGGALKINDVFWREFLDNATFFSTGNGNVSTGGGSALDSADGAAINAAEIKFSQQTDPDGKPLAISPSILLVPPTLLNTAVRWMGGQLIVSTVADNTLPNVNVYQGRYRVASSPYMENASYTGNSDAAWYLLADPSDLPVIEVVFLNGQEMPTIESADADFNTLGIQTRAYHDFGVRKQEPRGGVRSAGS